MKGEGHASPCPRAGSETPVVTERDRRRPPAGWWLRRLKHRPHPVSGQIRQRLGQQRIARAGPSCGVCGRPPPIRAWLEPITLPPTRTTAGAGRGLGGAGERWLNAALRARMRGADRRTPDSGPVERYLPPMPRMRRELRCILHPGRSDGEAALARGRRSCRRGCRDLQTRSPDAPVSAGFLSRHAGSGDRAGVPQQGRACPRPALPFREARRTRYGLARHLRSL